jgi:hypothetical protein
MKNFIALLLLIIPFTLFAQTEKNYLEGAVPVVEGKVTFSTEMNVGSLTKEQIYETLLAWAKKRYTPNEKHNARILYNSQQEGSIAIAGDEYIVFTSNALALDRTRIYYQIKMNIQNGKCQIEMTRIRYHYDEARESGVKYVAEEWITDEVSLNKSKTKIYPIMGKFRRKTIDLKDEIFKDIQAVLGNKMIDLGMAAAPVKPENHVTVSNNSSSVAVPMATPASEQPETATSNEEDIIKQAVRMTITAGNDEQFEISKECWGGFGELFGKKVAFCLIDTQKTMGNMLMAQSETYKISFYSANNSQPAVIINCKKLMSQTINSEEAQKMSPSCVVGKSYNMYVGEIIK